MLTIVKKNDSYDAITYQLENEDNSTVDLTGASVNFVMGKKNKLITNAKATVTSATSGIVSYQLTPSDTLVSGTFLAEFVVTFANGTVKTYPSNGYITVDVEQNLDTSQANVVVDMIAEKQGDFTSKLNSILLQAGNINMSAMNEYSWTATEGQLIFIFPSSVNYTPSTKWFQLYVGNIPVDNTFINRSYSNQFTLNVDSSNIKAGMTVRAMWVEPITPLTDNVVRTINGLIPDVNGNVEITIPSDTAGSGSGVLVYQTLADLKVAYPNGVNQPAWIVADNSWYYWDGVVTADTTAPVLTITSGGTFTGTKSVTMSTNETSTIYYTLDGTTPTTSSLVYSSVLSLSSTTTLKAFAKDTAGNSSSVQTVTYTLGSSDTTAPTVTVSPVAGTYTSTQSVTLTANETATIYYTLDGSTPTTGSAVYSSPISVSTTKTLKYFAVDTAGNQSTVQTNVYTINIPDTTAPVLTITPAATFTDTQTVTMSATDASSYTIWYTVDGTDPTTSGTKVQYTSPVTLSATTTVKAYAVDSANNASAVQTVTYTKQAASYTVSDSFNRADSATTLGNSDTGQAWTAIAGTWGISSNQAYLAGLSGGSAAGGACLAVIDSTKADTTIQCKFNSPTTNQRLVFRCTDGSNYWIINTEGKYTMYKMVAGTFNGVGTSTSSAPANGDIIKVVTSGSNITVYVNGTQALSATDSFNSTATKHGISHSATGNHRYDDFTVL